MNVQEEIEVIEISDDETVKSPENRENGLEAESTTDEENGRSESPKNKQLRVTTTDEIESSVSNAHSAPPSIISPSIESVSSVSTVPVSAPVSNESGSTSNKDEENLVLLLCPPLMRYPKAGGAQASGQENMEQHFQLPTLHRVPVPNHDHPSSSSDQAPIRDDPRQTTVDDFLRRINAGQSIVCLMCDDVVPERLLLHHLCQEHFYYYRPFQCGECDYRTGDIDELSQFHVVETNHNIGLENYRVRFPRNENTEFIIKVVCKHCMEAHGADENGKEAIISRIIDATKALRRARLTALGKEDEDDMDLSMDTTDDDDEPPNTAPIPVPPAPSPSVSDIEMRNTASTGCEPLMDHHSTAIPMITTSTNGPTPLSSTAQGYPVIHDNSQSIPKEPTTLTATNTSRSNVDQDKSTKHGSPPPVLTAETTTHDISSSSVLTSSTDSPLPILTPVLMNSVDSSIMEVSTTTADEIQPPTVASPQPAVTPTPGKPHPLACDFCNTILHNSLHLKDHGIRNHTAGYIQFKCGTDGCKFATWRARDFREHANRKHGQNLGKLESANFDPQQKAQLRKLVDSFVSKNVPCDELKNLLKD